MEWDEGLSGKRGKKNKKYVLRQKYSKIHLLVEVPGPLIFVFERGGLVAWFWHKEKGSHWMQVEHGRL